MAKTQCTPKAARSVRERLYSRSVVMPSGCIEWTGFRNADGYGSIGIGRSVQRAHRVAYELHNKVKLTKNQYVLHRCDNPPCINPDHLFAGTQRDNVLDAVSKGRFKWPVKFGTDHPNCKLSDSDVQKLRDAYASGAYTQRQVAKMFGVTQQHASVLVLKKWRAGG